MADRSTLKNNLRYHRVIAVCIVMASIWGTYEFTKTNPSYQNGQQKISGQHVNGKDEGLWTWFYENGKKQMQGNFVHGQRTGVWTIWDSSGNKLNESLYEGDKLNGKFTRWYGNGIKESEGTYADDQLQGEVVYYNTDGTLKEKKYFNNGVEQ
ncbi:MAG: hypothetical protein POELPBGB_01124 [Bacteroidia bacterium]|nr:hypothetical protein [Bacteroidia bacterium]